MYADKYKDREPLETVKIVQDFFKSLGLNIVEKICFASEIGTWTFRVAVCYQGREIYATNGKGMSKDFAIASGYGELYERFCNHYIYDLNPIFRKLKKEKYGYYYSPNEQKISLDECINSFPVFKKYFDLLFPNEEMQNSYFSTMLEDKNIGVEYISINDNTKQYISSPLVGLVMGSTGLSAGNSLKEALNQGISEIFERLAYNSFIEKNQEYYYELDVLNMDIPEDLKEKIEIIQNNPNYTIRFFDLSYNFHLPVILGILIDQQNAKILPSLGSFPIFNIALERVVTELYQGTYSFSSFSLPNIRSVQKPFDFEKPYYVIATEDLSTYKFINYIRESVLYTNNIKTNKYSDCYLNKIDSNNEEIYEFIKYILKKNNIQCLYRDTSLDKRLFSVQIFCSNCLLWAGKFVALEKEKDKINRQKVLDFCIKNILWIKNQYTGFVPNVQPPQNKYEHLYLCLLSYNHLYTIERALGAIHSTPDFYPLLISKFLERKSLKMLKAECVGLEIEPSVNYFLLIQQYKEKYKDDMICYSVLKQIGFNIKNIEDVKYCSNIQYLYQHIFIDTFKKSYQSSFYQKLLEIF